MMVEFSAYVFEGGPKLLQEETHYCEDLTDFQSSHDDFRILLEDQKGMFGYVGGITARIVRTLQDPYEHKKQINILRSWKSKTASEDFQKEITELGEYNDS